MIINYLQRVKTDDGIYVSAQTVDWNIQEGETFADHKYGALTVKEVAMFEKPVMILTDDGRFLLTFKEIVCEKYQVKE